MKKTLLILFITLGLISTGANSLESIVSIEESQSSFSPGSGVAGETNITPIELNEADQVASLFNQENTLLVLASFFGFGLLLSLTPCVFPMIPILSGIIVGHKGEMNTRKATGMSVVFVLSMSITYALAGVMAGYFGENLQILFQNPWALGLFSSVFVLLALSMFGFYEIQLPTSIQNKIMSMSNNQEGGHLLGVSIMGFLSALIVGPCVAPPLAGALIYIGQTGDALLGGMALFVMSLGMGAPLIAVGAGVTKLPSGGGWMENIKYIFGVLMLAVAIWLIERVIPEVYSLILWALLFTLAPITMGFLNNITNVESGWIRLYKGVGLIILGYGIILWILIARGGGDMTTPLKVVGGSQGVDFQEVIQNKIAFEKITTVNDLNSKLKEAAENKKLVMLDFYADWCISCKEIEKNVFSDKAVINEMNDVLALKADLTENNEDDKALMKKFQIVGPPAILFFKDGIENRNQRIVGEINATDFLKKLNSL